MARSTFMDEALRHHPKLSGEKKFILSLPILISVSWMAYLQYKQYTYGKFGYNGEFLAPANIFPLMTALVIFTVGYIIFILLMFSENIKEAFEKRVRH